MSHTTICVCVYYIGLSVYVGEKEGRRAREAVSAHVTFLSKIKRKQHQHYKQSIVSYYAQLDSKKNPVRSFEIQRISTNLYEMKEFFSLSHSLDAFEESSYG